MTCVIQILRDCETMQDFKIFDLDVTKQLSLIDYFLNLIHNEL